MSRKDTRGLLRELDWMIFTIGYKKNDRWAFRSPETAETSDQLKSIQIVMLMAKMAPRSLARPPDLEHRSKSISARAGVGMRRAPPLEMRGKETVKASFAFDQP